MKARHFFRCRDCLGVWAAEVEIAMPPPNGGYVSAWRAHGAVEHAIAPILAGGCPYVCGADPDPEQRSVEHMGQIDACGRVSRFEGTESPCDSSCQFARGPKCECSCGGSNHGGGVLVEIVIVSDQGKAESRFKTAPKSQAQAVLRAGEWRAMEARLDDAAMAVSRDLLALHRRKDSREFLPESEFRRMLALRNWERARKEASDLKTHQGRMKAAAKLIEAAAGAVPAGGAS